MSNIDFDYRIFIASNLLKKSPLFIVYNEKALQSNNESEKIFYYFLTNDYSKLTYNYKTYKIQLIVLRGTGVCEGP